MKIQTILKASAAILMAASTSAAAQDFNIPGGDLARALSAYTQQTGQPLVVSGEAVRGVQSRGAKGNLSEGDALTSILSGTGFTVAHEAGVIAIVRGERQSSNVDLPAMQLAQTTPEHTAVETVTVTSSKLGGGDVQSIPIAITALSEEQLNAQKIEGGPDLLKSVPNMTFSKNNFSGYNISIRGIGTKAISVTTDPGVAVNFNDTTLIRNRFFEQEFFDMEQVEVLRGPQGTLYGRNATGGVVNIVSAKPTDQFAGEIKGEVGNYDSKRLRGFINMPIIGDKLDLRVAGSLLKRDGYDYNSVTENRIDGRDLWSTRVTVGFKPIERLHGDLIWEHFNENDNRQRTGKQLCHRDPGPESIGDQTDLGPITRASFSQGCLPGSLYDAGAFGTPNGLSIPFILYASGALIPFQGAGFTGADGKQAFPLKAIDPYGGMMQSPDLRTVASLKDPRYRAQADVIELNTDFEVTPSLTITSQTAYDRDNYYSMQDYNRFNSLPVFNDNSSATADRYDPTTGTFFTVTPDDPRAGRSMPAFPGGYFNDPQLGSSNTIVGVDVNKAKSTQFSQELRMHSNFEGSLNFSAGANYNYYKTLEDYYVFYNLLTAVAEITNYSSDFYTGCAIFDFTCGILNNPRRPLSDPDNHAIYIDPNPLNSINGEGHNYFRSINPYTLRSFSTFGELYWQVAPDVKLTAGLRYTDDHKTFTPHPTEVLLSSAYPIYGLTDRGFVTLPDIKQRWGEVTGRVNVDWQPKLTFTDQTLVYASYSRGYKGGGANPPSVGFGVEPSSGEPFFTVTQYAPTFKPEFVNAFEVGTKNTLLDGALTLNGDAFFYDYKNYQISKIVDRTAINENFDAKVWGLEAETVWEPTPGLRFNLSTGFEGSRLADGSKSIDLMDRTAGNPDYIVNKPYVLLPSNCIIPVAYAAQMIASYRANGIEDTSYIHNCPGQVGFDLQALDPSTLPNDGVGLYKDIGGNELPNTPHLTLSLGAQYALPINSDWTALVRGDFYWQTNSWARVYNDNPYDVLHGWTNANITLDILRGDGLQLEVYVKNVFNRTAITDAFLNSDDSALTTNVFVTDPRLIGFSVTKNF